MKSLRCSRCDWQSPIDALYNLCPKCSAPILVHYELTRLGRVSFFGPSSSGQARPDIWVLEPCDLAESIEREPRRLTQVEVARAVAQLDHYMKSSFDSRAGRHENP